MSAHAIPDVPVPADPPNPYPLAPYPVAAYPVAAYPGARPGLAVVPDPPEERAVDAATFRAVFRRHAAAVVVITADAGHGPVGFTATSLVSVSLLPPLVAFAISTTASSWQTVSAAGSVVVNFLDAGQHELARRFATSGIDRFAEPTRWSTLGTGEPVLDEAPSYLRGLVEHRFTVGDHHLVVARLAGHAERREHEPLLYHDGRYATTDRPDFGGTNHVHRP